MGVGQVLKGQGGDVTLRASASKCAPLYAIVFSLARAPPPAAGHMLLR